MLDNDYLGKWVSKQENSSVDGESAINIIDVVEVNGDFVICPNNVTMSKSQLTEKYEKPNLSDIDPFMSSGLQAMKTKEFSAVNDKVVETQSKGVADYSDYVAPEVVADQPEEVSYGIDREAIRQLSTREKLVNEDLIMSMVDRIKVNKNLNKTSINTNLEFGISIDDLINSCSLLGLEKSEVLEVLKYNIDSIITIDTIRKNIVEKVSKQYGLNDLDSSESENKDELCVVEPEEISNVFLKEVDDDEL